MIEIEIKQDSIKLIDKDKYEIYYYKDNILIDHENNNKARTYPYMCLIGGNSVFNNYNLAIEFLKNYEKAISK